MEIQQTIFTSTTEELQELLKAQLPEGVKVKFNNMDINIIETENGKIVTPMKVEKIYKMEGNSTVPLPDSE